MCDLVAPLLVIFDDESLSYGCFCHLMERMIENFPSGNAMDMHLANMRWNWMQIPTSFLYSKIRFHSFFFQIIDSNFRFGNVWFNACTWRLHTFLLLLSLVFARFQARIGLYGYFSNMGNNLGSKTCGIITSCIVHSFGTFGNLSRYNIIE